MATTNVATEFVRARAVILTRIAGALVNICNISNTLTIIARISFVDHGKKKVTPEQRPLKANVDSLGVVVYVYVV